MILTKTANPRILLAECIHEICSFNPVPTRYEDFFVNTGEQIFAYHKGIGSEISGAMNILGGLPGVTLVPTFTPAASRRVGRFLRLISIGCRASFWMS